MIENGKLNIEKARRTPIPMDLPSVTGWKEVPIIEHDTPLVPIGMFTEFSDLYTDSLYRGERISSPYVTPLQGSYLTVFLRRELANKLQMAQSYLPSRYYLRVVDGYRDLQVQQALFDEFLEEIKGLYPDKSLEEHLEEAQKYVSIPSTDPTRPSPHNTGGAVDLDIVRVSEDDESRIEKHGFTAKRDGDWREAYASMHNWSYGISGGEVLNFGTPIDDATRASKINYYEGIINRNLTPQEQDAKENRRILYALMRSVGLETYPDEWWHYNSQATQMGAKTAGRERARFGAISLSEANRVHEDMRLKDYLGRLRIHSRNYLEPKVNPRQAYLDVVKALVDTIGSPRESTLAMSTRISSMRTV